MIYNVDISVAEIGVRLLDDAYLAWFSAESDCERALHAWFAAAGAERASTYLAYRAALDREDAAARDLARLWQVSTPCRKALVHGDRSVFS